MEFVQSRCPGARGVTALVGERRGGEAGNGKKLHGLLLVLVLKVLANAHACFGMRLAPVLGEVRAAGVVIATPTVVRCNRKKKKTKRKKQML